MLTRFEVSGFKNLRDVAVDLGPFTCIAGPNGVGKSNLFDAIAFLGALADHSFNDAIASVRSVPGQRGTQESVLSAAVLSGEENLRLAAEMIIPGSLRDARGRRVTLRDTYLRYEVELGVDTEYRGNRSAPIRLITESLESATRPPACPALAEAVQVPQSRRTYIEPGPQIPLAYEAGSGTMVWDVYDRDPEEYLGPRDDGEFPSIPDHSYFVGELDRTALSQARAGTVPGQVAAQLRSWRFLALEPSLIRAADSIDEAGRLADSGAHLPAALNARAEERGAQIYDGLRRALGDLLDLRHLEVIRNGDFLELRAQVGEGPELPARALSDGSLRLLVLGALATGIDGAGAVFIEEPENGVHPARLRALLDLLRSMAGPRQEGQEGYGQVVINTHSPYVVQEVLEAAPGDVLCAVSWRRSSGAGEVTTSTSFHPLPGTWRAAGREGPGDERRIQPVSRTELIDFLESPVMAEGEQ
ncbi:AAA family ATPase [Actinomyces capricornis]|uniref:ATPase AAA-type core domain-containing protein n=1 Tax=Actinomyces capricornis TaxID=2755559 RepID=A0ABM7UCZ4_9ACTO|nr:ATP-binding protein [Actinomyces capricornis]BDA65075.1 hypothetical protein MANAM107_19090 [Actinomyces capricornis]